MQVQPTANAVCYTGAALLGQFGIPFPSDAANVSAKYPWLEGFAAGACPAERLPKGPDSDSKGGEDAAADGDRRGGRRRRSGWLG